MRWWGVIALSILVIVAETLLFLGAPTTTLSVASIVRTAIWLAPLWIIAWRYRKLFR